jgi:hypothetical protein
MAFENAGRRHLDGFAVGHVARLVLVGRGRRPRDPDHARPATLERLHDLGSDPGRGAGDDC